MSIFSRLNPANLIPRFPAYLGPYAVGSFELEIPVASLAPAGSVDGVSETVQFRVFYPTEKLAEKPASPTSGWWGGENAPEEDLSGVPNQNQNSKPVRWLPEPHQREYLSAYARFLGASSGFAEIVSHISRLLHYITLPVTADAPLLPTPHRLPTMIFSHGLGGTRLAYSHICCSIASYGVVVIAPEHRDGSAPVSFVSTPAKPSSTPLTGTKPTAGEPGIDEASAAPQNGRAQVDYTTYPHHVSEETAAGRNGQLEIRLRELGLIHTAITRLDAGQIPPAALLSSPSQTLLPQFASRLDIHTPGRLILTGHSFGASTMFQLLKTTTCTTPHKNPLFTPTPALKAQLTPETPLLLLDLWCLPLLGARTRSLFTQPLPQIAAGNGRNICIIMSEEFWRWKENLAGVRRVLSPDPGRPRADVVAKWFDEEHSEQEKGPQMASREDAKLETGDQIVPPDGTTPTPTRPGTAAGTAEPRFYYVAGSAHLSQSDFGVLFPRAAKKATGKPEWILEMNVRAVVQWLREVGFKVGVEEGDKEIFDGVVEGWKRIGLKEEEAEVEKAEV